MDVLVGADCNDGAGVRICCRSSGATGSKGYCDGAAADRSPMAGKGPMGLAEKCDNWSDIGAIIICCSMNGVMELGDGR